MPQNLDEFAVAIQKSSATYHKDSLESAGVLLTEEWQLDNWQLKAYDKLAFLKATKDSQNCA